MNKSQTNWYTAYQKCDEKKVAFGENFEEDYDNRQNKINKLELGDDDNDGENSHFSRQEKKRQNRTGFHHKSHSPVVDIDPNFIKDGFKKCNENDPNYLYKSYTNSPELLDYDPMPGYSSEDKIKMHRRGKTADCIVAVTSKPFKTEYEHEYGGGRLKTDPRRESDERWYLPHQDKCDPKMPESIQRSINFRRKNNRIAGPYYSTKYSSTNPTPIMNVLDNQRCFRVNKSAASMGLYDQQTTRETGQRQSQCSKSQRTFKWNNCASGLVSTKVGNTNKPGGENLIGRNHSTLPYGVEPIFEHLDHTTRKYYANHEDVKRVPEIGTGGGGVKQIRIFNGRILDKPIYQKYPHASLIPRGYAGYPTGLNLADTKNQNPENLGDEDNKSVDRVSYQSFTESFWKRIQNETSKTEPKKNYSGSYLKMSSNAKGNNPFEIPKQAVRQPMNKYAQKTNFLKELDTNWSKFCRGQLGSLATLDCQSCGYALCKQADVVPHS